MKSAWDIVGSVVLVLLGVVLTYVIFNRANAPDQVAPRPPAPEPIAAKPMLVYVTSAKCLWCDKMKRQTLAAPKVSERVARDFNFVEASGKEAVARYSVKAYPTYVIIAVDGRELRRGSGYRNAEEFLAWIDEPQRRMDMPEFTPLDD